MAYYTAMMTMCLNPHPTLPSNVSAFLVASFNTLAAGSSFFHASGTSLGGGMDTVPISHIALASYQNAVRSLAPDYVLANARPRSQASGLTVNGTDLIAKLSRAYLSENLYDWSGIIRSTLPTYQNDYYITFGCTVSLMLRLFLPSSTVDKLLPVIAKIMHLAPSETAFLVSEYDPILRNALVSHPVRLTQRLLIFKRGLGTLLKMVYAFVWQEGIFVGPWLTSPKANSVGGWLMPSINRSGDMLTGYVHSSDVRMSKNVYPGDDQVCRAVVAHAKWHEQSANALLDLVSLTADAGVVLAGREISSTAADDALATAAQSCLGHLHDQELVAELLTSAEIGCLTDGSPDRGLRCLAKLWFGDSATAMDGCLLENDCLAATPNGLSVVSLVQCVTTTCLPLVHSPISLTACLAKAATSDVLAAISCLRDYSTFSPVGSALLDCASVAQSNPGPSLEHDFLKFSQCVADGLQAEQHRRPMSSAWWLSFGRFAGCALNRT